MYQVTANTNGNKVIYGIKHTESGKEVKEVSANLHNVQELAKKMNNGKLDPIHMQDVIDDYTGEESADKWISVTERLPEVGNKPVKGKEVIVAIQGAKEATVLYYDGKDFTDSFDITYKVTHWRPLPELPQEAAK